MKFARGYPLLALMCGWLAMVGIDWIVTSEAIPRLVSLLTARPWSPFSESFVLRAALHQPVFLDDSGLGIGQAVKARLVSGELILDDLIWRTQAFVASSLLPLAHSHALLWLCMALISLGAVRKYSKAGPRAALLCIAYFAAADYAVWSTLGAAPLNSIASSALVVQPLYECSSSTCTLAIMAPLPRHGEPPLHPYLQLNDIRSPFSDAVQQAVQMRKALVKRRTERLRRLHGWRQRVKQTVRDQSMDGSGHISVIATLATLSFYACLAYWAAQHIGVSALRTFMVLFGMDVLLHGGFASLGRCVLAHGSLSEDDGVLSVSADTDANVKALVAGSLGCAHALLANTAGFWSCVMAKGAHSMFDSHTATSGRLLPIHVLNVAVLLALRECAYAVHNMRAWYAAVVRERRRGPAILTGRRSGSVQITVSRCDEPIAPTAHVPGVPTTTAARYAAYAHRICFMCLGGFCERCLLSMEIWPTADGVAMPVGTDNGDSASDAQKQQQQHLPPVTAATAAAAAAAAAATTSQHIRRRTKTGARNGGRSAPTASNAAASLPSTSTTAGSISPVTADSLAADVSANGLPPLYEALRTIADIVDQQPALQGTNVLSEAVLAGRLGGQNQGNQSGSRRSRTVDVWITSSVAHCPCRLVHGVGPSSFVAKPASGGIRANSDGEKPPAGTLLALAQYARELKSLGLVRSVDPVSAVHADDDPAASVLPLIFGRFAVPENPQAVAAANALLQSSGGHTPGDVPFLRTGPSTRQGPGLPSGSLASDAAGAADLADTCGGDGTRRPSRILAKPTPLSAVRSLGSGTFRLSADAVLASQGAVHVSVVMTPVLAHLLLTHPRTAPTAAVCVPASLVSAIVARARRSHASGSRSAKAAAAADGNGGSADIDPFVDYARVQLLRSDIVVRINGVRWHDFELDSSGMLNRPLSVRNLAPNHMHAVCVSVCGMRSEELAVVVPAVDAPTALFGRDPARRRGSGSLSLSDGGVLASKKADDVAACTAHLEVLRKQQQMAQQKLRKTKRELPRQIQNLQNELESVRRVLSRHAESSARFEPHRTHLAASIGAVAAESNELRSQLGRLAHDIEMLAETPVVREDSATSGSGVPGDMSGFNVLATLDDHGAKKAAADRSSYPTAAAASPTTADQALAEYKGIEMRARRAQDMHEEALQGLKADRAQWMAQLSQLTQRLGHLDTLIDPVRRNLKEVTRLATVGAITETTLCRKMDEIRKNEGGKKEALSSGDRKPPSQPRHNNRQKKQRPKKPAAKDH
ncbi:hypothetical protein EV175_004793 [Coemansia sp. RSA 1933]|nr:hypothetical protein EV175_004793 [Coemansia sp. RSA 1933]